MLTGMLGRATQASSLKDLLDVSAQRTKAIADRVSRASISSADGFSLAPGSASADGEPPIDLETEMVSLADEQLHFEATAKLLQKAYEQLRTAIRDK
jgi:hypothetical protein